MAIPGFQSGRVWRSTESVHLAGGKPVNVARILRRLGIPATLVMPLGGSTGEFIGRACRELGIEVQAVSIEGETRTCVVVANPQDGTATVMNEPGPPLHEEAGAEFLMLSLEQLEPGGLILGSGSLPPGLSDEFYGHVAQEAHRLGAHFILDSSGPALARAIPTAPWAIKVNRDELLQVTGEGTEDQGIEVVLDAGVQHVVVTHGKEGAVYAGRSGRLKVPAANITPINPIGAGDAFLAGLAGGLWRDMPWPEALRLASATAGASAARFEPDIDPDPDLAALLTSIGIE